MTFNAFNWLTPAKFRLVAASKFVNILDNPTSNKSGVIESLITLLNINSRNILFVGDSLKDVEAAHAAGMPAGYISGGEDPPELVRGSSAEIEVKAIGEIFSIISSEKN